MREHYIRTLRPLNIVVGIVQYISPHMLEKMPVPKAESEEESDDE